MKMACGILSTHHSKHLLVNFKGHTFTSNFLKSSLATNVKWKWKWKVAQSYLTLCDPMVSTVHEILQTRILEWVAFPFSRGSSQPRDQTQVSRIAGGLFISWPTREAQEYWSGLPFPSPRDFPHPGIKPRSPALAGRFFTAEHQGSPDFRMNLKTKYFQ